MQSKIIVVREENQDWLSSEEQGELRWKLLVDSSIGSSSGLSLGLLKIKPNYELPLHHHNPNEIYLIKRGIGLLIKSKQVESLKLVMRFIFRKMLSTVYETQVRPHYYCIGYFPQTVGKR